MTESSPQSSSPQSPADSTSAATPAPSDPVPTSPASPPISPPAVRYPVLLEAVEGGWIASILGVATYRAIGPTRDAAVQGLEKVMHKRLEQLLPLGGEVTQVLLPFPIPSSPLLRFAGQLKDDPYFDDYMESIAEYRRVVDEELHVGDASLEDPVAEESMQEVA